MTLLKITFFMDHLILVCCIKLAVLNLLSYLLLSKTLKGVASIKYVVVDLVISSRMIFVLL